jgi:hypothetical protein
MYKPNFNDKRVFNKATRALGFAQLYFNDDQPKSIRSRKIDKFLGRTNEPLGSYLRNLLLKIDNPIYNMDKKGETKTYLANQEGIESLRASIDCSVHSRVLHSDQSFNNTTRNNKAHVIHPSVRVLTQITESYRTEFENNTFNYVFNYNDMRWHHKLQSEPKHIRDHVFKTYGYNYHYDIDASLPSIILSLNYQLGTSEVLPVIHDDVIDNKHSVRQRLSEKLNIDNKTAKRLLTATFNGAHATLFPRSSIYKMLIDKRDEDLVKDKIAWLKTDPWYQQLKQEVKECWQHILPHYEHKRQYKKNGHKKPFYPKQKAQIYFEHEHRVAESIHNYLKHNMINYYWIHDGFQTDQQVNTQDLEHYIFQHTRFLIKLSGENK